MAQLEFYDKSRRPNRHNLPDFIVRALEYSPRDWDLKFIENSIGVTTLMDSPKIKLLRKKYKDRIREDNDISNDVKLFFGTMAHLLVERAIQSYYKDPIFKEDPLLIPISEKRIVIPYPASELTNGIEYNIVMKPDITYIKDGVLYDLKTGTTWDWKFRVNKIKTWKEQLDMYKYGIETYGFEYMSPELKKLFESGNLKINKAIILLWMKDWSASEAERESNYPEFEMVQIEISLSDNKTIKNRITSRILLHSTYLSDPQQYDCTPEERMSKKTEFAVFSKAGAAKATKVFKDKPTDEENKADAYAFLDEISKKFPFASVVERSGLPVRCVKNYCSVADFCNQYRQEIGLPPIEKSDEDALKGVVIKSETSESDTADVKHTPVFGNEKPFEIGDLFGKTETPKEEPKKEDQPFSFTFGETITIQEVKNDSAAEPKQEEKNIDISQGIDFNFKL